MENKTLEILNPIKDNILGVIINESIKGLDNPTSEQLYDATRKQWRIDQSKINKLKYVFGIANGIIKIIIKVNNVEKNVEQKNYIFEGETNFADHNLNSLVGEKSSLLLVNLMGQRGDIR